MEKLTFEKMYEIYRKCEDTSGDSCEICPLALGIGIECNSICSYIYDIEQALEKYNFNFDE